MKTPFPPNKTFAELGLDKNRKFVVVDDNGHSYFKRGDIVSWVKVTDTCPFFRRESDGYKAHIYLWRLAYADEPKTWHNLEKGDVLKHDNVTVQGDVIVQGYVGDVLFAMHENGFVYLKSIEAWQELGWKIKNAQHKCNCKHCVEDIKN